MVDIVVTIYTIYANKRRDPMLGGMDGRYSQGVTKAHDQMRSSDTAKGSRKLSEGNQKINKIGSHTLSKKNSLGTISESKPKASMLGAGLQKLANKISNFFGSIFGSKIDKEEPLIDKKKFFDEMNGGDVFLRDSKGGGIVNGTIVYGNSRVYIPTVEVDLRDQNITSIYDDNYKKNVSKISTFLDQDPDLKLCEKVLKTLMSQTITAINEKSTDIQFEKLEEKFITKATGNINLKSNPRNTLDYTFTIKKRKDQITIEVRGTNKYELDIKESGKSLPPEEQLDPVVVDVEFDIVINKKAGHIKRSKINGETIEQIVDFDIRNEKVEQRPASKTAST